MNPDLEDVRVGLFIKTEWSSRLVILEVLYTIKKLGRTFYGVRFENLDEKTGDWLQTEGPLWVYKEGRDIRIWQECRQRPRFIEGEPESDEIRKIIGHYYSQTGLVYYAIMWAEYMCPTWELEEDLDSCSQLITEYYKAHITQGISS